MKVVVQEEWFSLKQCNNNPSYIYVFGDNLLRVGEAGQAQIRSASNSIGKIHVKIILHSLMIYNEFIKFIKIHNFKI